MTTVTATGAYYLPAPQRAEFRAWIETFANPRTVLAVKYRRGTVTARIAQVEPNGTLRTKPATKGLPQIVTQWRTFPDAAAPRADLWAAAEHAERTAAARAEAL